MSRSIRLKVGSGPEEIEIGSVLNVDGMLVTGTLEAVMLDSGLALPVTLTLPVGALVASNVV